MGVTGSRRAHGVSVGSLGLGGEGLDRFIGRRGHSLMVLVGQKSLTVANGSRPCQLVFAEEPGLGRSSQRRGGDARLIRPFEQRRCRGGGGGGPRSPPLGRPLQICMYIGPLDAIIPGTIASGPLQAMIIFNFSSVADEFGFVLLPNQLA